MIPEIETDCENASREKKFLLLAFLERTDESPVSMSLERGVC